MRVFKKIIRVFHTIKHLKFSQLYGRIWFRLYKPSPDLSNRPDRRPQKLWTPSIDKPHSMISETRFEFLNQVGDLEQSKDWNSSKHNKIWLYNLHYFDYLNSKTVNGASRHQENIIERWLTENPPGHGNGWEPYPTSLRLVNWSKWIMSGNKPSADMTQSMAIQTKYLNKRCEYHLLGNHLFVNGKALLFMGLFFKGDIAEGWFSKGQKIINKEIAEQVLNDGGNFERTPMYHAIFLEDILDIINILKASGRPVCDRINDLVIPMLVWLQAMSHPDGDVSFFNDSAIGISPSYEALEAYASRLGFRPAIAELKKLSIFKESGYVRLHDYNIDAILDLAPIGPDYIPGHAHADSLSFEMSVFGHRCLVNTGTSIYGISNERLRQRGTAAHNTLVIDNDNSSEVWAGFRVARRARIKDVDVLETEKDISVSGSHTGYMRLRGKPIHKRKWVFSANQLLIQDDVISNQKHMIDVIFHFHPDWHISLDGNIAIIRKGTDKVYMEFDKNGEVEVQNSSYHPEFGISLANKKIVYHQHSKCPATIRTSILWRQEE